MTTILWHEVLRHLVVGEAQQHSNPAPYLDLFWERDEWVGLGREIQQAGSSSGDRRTKKWASYHRPGQLPPAVWWVAVALWDDHPHRTLKKALGGLVGPQWWSLCWLSCLRSKSVYIWLMDPFSGFLCSDEMCIMLVLFLSHTIFIHAFYTWISILFLPTGW